MDPITLIAGATAAFNGVKQLIDHGKDIESVFKQLSKWASYTSDLQEWCRTQDTTPGIFKKLKFGDDTAEAINAISIRFQLAQQEKELREMFQWYGPPGAYEEFIAERRRIKAERERLIYEQARNRRAFLWNALYISLLTIAVATVAAMLFTMYSFISTR